MTITLFELDHLNDSAVKIAQTTIWQRMIELLVLKKIVLTNSRRQHSKSERTGLTACQTFISNFHCENFSDKKLTRNLGEQETAKKLGLIVSVFVQTIIYGLLLIFFSNSSTVLFHTIWKLVIFKNDLYI